MLKLENISVTYGRKDNTFNALENISLNIQEGEFLTVTGKSGCGKTTLLNVVGGIRKPDRGSYFFKNENVLAFSDKQMAKFRNLNIGFIVQHFALIQDRSVHDNIALPLIYRRMPRKLIDEKVETVLKSVNIDSKRNKYPFELSGGESQRVAIARAIVTEPKVIIADEPTGALDEETGHIIINILKELNKSGKTIILVTHDLELAEEGTRKICMRDGRII